MSVEQKVPFAVPSTAESFSMVISRPEVDVYKDTPPYQLEIAYNRLFTGHDVLQTLEIAPFLHEINRGALRGMAQLRSSQTIFSQNERRKSALGVLNALSLEWMVMPDKNNIDSYCRFAIGVVDGKELGSAFDVTSDYMVGDQETYPGIAGILLREGGLLSHGVLTRDPNKLKVLKDNLVQSVNYSFIDRILSGEFGCYLPYVSPPTTTKQIPCEVAPNGYSTSIKM